MASPGYRRARGNSVPQETPSPPTGPRLSYHRSQMEAIAAAAAAGTGPPRPQACICLDRDALVSIFEFGTARTLLTARLVCRSWASSTKFVKCVCVCDGDFGVSARRLAFGAGAGHIGASPGSSASFFRLFPCASSISMEWDAPEAWMGRGPSVATVAAGPVLGAILDSRAPGVRLVRLKMSPVTLGRASHAPLFLAALPKLQHLHLQGSMTMPASALDAAMSSMTSLVTLHIGGFWTLSDAHVGMIVRAAAPTLVKLSITDAPSVTRPTIQDAPTLRHLRLSRCMLMVRPVLSNLPSLTELDYSASHLVTNKAVRDAVTAVPSLRCIDVSQCERISRISITTLQHLEVVGVVSCICLQSLHLESPCLSFVYCENVPCLETAVVSSPKLVALAVAFAPALRELTIFASKLRVLDLQGDAALRSVEVSAPSLRHLRTSGCSPEIARQIREATSTATSNSG